MIYQHSVELFFKIILYSIAYVYVYKFGIMLLDISTGSQLFNLNQSKYGNILLFQYFWENNFSDFGVILGQNFDIWLLV